MQSSPDSKTHFSIFQHILLWAVAKRLSVQYYMLIFDSTISNIYFTLKCYVTKSTNVVIKHYWAIVALWVMTAHRMCYLP